MPKRPRRFHPRADSGARSISLGCSTCGYGNFIHYHLLARGGVDIVIESDVNILDIAALVVIVREAGGVFTDLDGGEVGLQTTSVLAANPALHAIVARSLSAPD